MHKKQTIPLTISFDHPRDLEWIPYLYFKDVEVRTSDMGWKCVIHGFRWLTDTSQEQLYEREPATLSEMGCCYWVLGDII